MQADCLQDQEPKRETITPKAPQMTRHFHLPGPVALLTLVLCLIGCGPTTITIGPPGPGRLKSKTVLSDGAFVTQRIALVDMTGMIYNANKPSLLSPGENPVSLLHEKLEMAAKDQKVKAVILRINSPGGTVTATDVMYRQVMRFKTKTSKPVIALMMDVAASGGYYLACSADQIVAYPSTVTGSVGVLLQTVSLKPALTKIGIHAETFTSGPNKDVGSFLSTLTDEHRTILQNLVDDFYRRFVEVVRERRPAIPNDQFDTVTDGRVLSGDQALKRGLVDQIGDLHSAFELAKSVAKVRRADLVLYHRPMAYVGSPYARGALAGLRTRRPGSTTSGSQRCREEPGVATEP